jgi:predicted ATP-grasp superfamily ATP-dependent carboligase
MHATKKINQAKILVTSAHRSSAVAIIRTLGRAGYRVLAADSSPRSLGFRSRFAHETVVYPSPDTHPQLFAEFLLKILKKKKIDLLIPVTDSEIHVILAFRELFEQAGRVALPENDLMEIVNDKVKTIQLAKKVGVPVPESYVVRNTKEALSFARNLTWPIVVKPQFSRKLFNGRKIELFQISYANSPEDLIRLMKNLEKRCDVILQAYHQGVGYGIELLTQDGEPIAAFAHKRLREIPISGGASCYRQSINFDNNLYSYALKLLKELRWTGVAMVEFKVNGSDVMFMEINGRIWGSLPLAVTSGVNFPLRLAKQFLNDNGAIITQFPNDYKVGLRCRNLGKDLMWIVSVLMQREKYSFFPIPKRSRAVKAILGLLNPLNKYDLFCLDDPMPGFAELPVIINKLWQKTRG